MSVSAIVDHFPYLGLFLLLIFGGIGLPFPEDTTLILCGFLIATHVVKPVPALFVVYSGILIADCILYLVGKKYGRMIITHKRFHKILSSERLSIIEDKFNKRGILFILVGRHLIGLRAQIFLVAGVMRMSVLKFFLADAISSLFTISVMVGIGYAGGQSIEVLKRDVSRIEHITILFIIVLLVIYLILRYFRPQKK